MQIRDFLQTEGIVIGSAASDKKSVLDTLVELHSRCGNLKNAATFYEQVLTREEEGTTAVGGATAIPHAQGDAVRRTGLCAMTLREGIDWGAPDGRPVQLIFLIAAPKQGGEHLAVLSRLITMLMNKTVARALARAETPEAFLSILEEEENARRMDPYKMPTPRPRNFPPDWSDVTPPDMSEPADTAFKGQEFYRVLAVVSNAPGKGDTNTEDNAYAYMATQALHSAAAQLGIPIKVETHGRDSSENLLTRQEMDQAEAIVIAADGPFDMSRFDGKRVVRGSLGDGIRNGEKMLRRAVSGTAPVYHNASLRQKTKIKTGKKASRSLPSLSPYLHKGAARVLPFYAAGGLLKMIGFLIDLFAGAPAAETFGYTSHAASLFYTVGTMLFTFALPVLSAFIAEEIAGRWGFTPGFIGGWLAVIGGSYLKIGAGVSSGMFGALFAGFAAGVLTLLLQKPFLRQQDTSKGGVYFCSTLCSVILTGAAVCAVNPLAAALYDGAYRLLEGAAGVSGILAGALAGACTALDMGGPLSRGAYVFAVASGGATLAAVAAAWITIPLSIALAVTVFRGHFPMYQRQSGAVNYILGIGGILEGAVPYAAANPLRVIPACLIGSAAAGAVTAAFGCTVSSSVGGMLAFRTAGGWMYMLPAIAVGAIISMFLLAAFHKAHVGEPAENTDSAKQSAAVLQQETV